MHLAWLVVQLVFWASAMVATVAACAVFVLAPPYWAIRYLLRRLDGCT